MLKESTKIYYRGAKGSALGFGKITKVSAEDGYEIVLEDGRKFKNINSSSVEETYTGLAPTTLFRTLAAKEVACR